ncbi:hypothetical protein O181_076017 [Austropuccinia psidii MF-1]|uniref:Uncharacterized protein n=1 Tax=Austropuccinia psidii MF-1 TaxID=1389203 RepID=A0A9Q3FDL3_9BASI|nr:hypothetical protein [Austropuccinia psidii MF-1]
MAIEHQRGPIFHKRYGVDSWPQLGSRLELPQHPQRRVNLCGCDRWNLGQDWLRWAQLWFGTHLALGACGLPPLAHAWQTVAYRLCTVEAVGGLNGPKRLISPGTP